MFFGNLAREDFQVHTPSSSGTMLHIHPWLVYGRGASNLTVTRGWDSTA